MTIRHAASIAPTTPNSSKPTPAQSDEAGAATYYGTFFRIDRQTFIDLVIANVTADVIRDLNHGATWHVVSDVFSRRAHTVDHLQIDYKSI